MDNNNYKIEIIDNKEHFTLQKLFKILKKVLLVCFVLSLFGVIVYLILNITGVVKPKVDVEKFEKEIKEYINTIDKAYSDFVASNDIRYISEYDNDGKYICMSILDFIKDKYVDSSENNKKGYIQKWIFKDGTFKYYINIAKGNKHIKGYSDNLKFYDDDNVISQCPNAVELPNE